MVGGVGWTTFRDSPHEIDFILVTQVRAIICCLLILFITQSGSCTLRSPRLLLCCFPLHRRQISSDITSSPLSSTATKTRSSKGLAWRLNKSACNSANVLHHGIEVVTLAARVTLNREIPNSSKTKSCPSGLRRTRKLARLAKYRLLINDDEGIIVHAQATKALTLSWYAISLAALLEAAQNSHERLDKVGQLENPTVA